MPTNIAWTDETWNPVHGCSKVSAGCDNCYAERISYHQYGHTSEPWTRENAAENVTERPDKLDYPSTLDEPARIFVNSMSDLFHAQVSEAFIREVFGVIRNHPKHVFQILTKRPGRAAQMELQWPPNVWMGTSVEDNRVIERLDLLRPCNADVLFVSFEPLIGPIADDHEDLDLSGFDWAIVGGESGPRDERREMAHEWVWPIRRACMEQDVAFFFKQSSAARPEQGQALRCPDGVRREFREMPPVNEAVENARNASEKRVVTDGGTDPRAALAEHGTLYDGAAARGGEGRTVHIDEDCSALAADHDDITDESQLPLRAHVCQKCDPDHEIDYAAGNNPRDDVPAIEDHDNLRADGAGERIAVSPVTGIVYAATEYEEAGEGKIVAKDERPLSRAEIAARLDDVHGPARRAYRDHLGVSADA